MRFLGVILGFCVLFITTKGQSFSRPEYILFINSYHPGYAWSDGETEGFQVGTAERRNLVVFTEYLDTKRFPENETFGRFYKYVSQKYSHISLTAIAGCDNAAFRFFKRYADSSLFAGKVGFFCGINDYMTIEKPSERAFVIRESNMLLLQAGLIKKLLPDTRKLIILSDDNRYFIDNFKSEIEIIQRGVNIELQEVSETRISKVRSILNTQPSGTVAFYYGIFQSGTTVWPDDTYLLELISKEVRLPIFSAMEHHIGHGVVGGYAYSGNNQGQRLGKALAQYLTGTRPDSLLLAGQTDSTLFFDYRKLKLFNIEPKSIPAGSRIHHTPQIILSIYRDELIGIGILFLMFLIAGAIVIFSTLRRRRVERSFRKVETKLNEFANLLPQVIYECDLQGRFTFLNRQSFELFGYPADTNPSDLTIYNVIAPEDQMHIRENIGKLVAGDTNRSLLFEAVRKDGSRFPFEIHSNLIVEQGRVIGLRGIGIDCTLKMQHEQELQEAKHRAEESDRLKSAFLTNVSHEIRTPLNSLIGFTNLIVDGNLTPCESQEYITYIRNSADHLLSLINDILDISRIESGQMELRFTRFYLQSFVREVYEGYQSSSLLKEKPNVRMLLDLPETLDDVAIEGDMVRLRQVITNLVDNALKFTFEGSVTLGYRLNDHQSVRFFCRDTGIGIPAKEHERIFNRFIKLNPLKERIIGGSGLGLSISRQLVELMGGEIWLDSEENKGTTFHFTIPLQLAFNTNAPLASVLRRKDNDWSGKRVLIAEDEDSNYRLIEAYLKPTRIEIVRALDGAMALEIMRQTRVDLALLDILMPNINGYEVALEVRKVYPGLPIIFQTAYTSYGADEAAYARLANDIVYKPVSRQKLIDVMEKIFTSNNK